MRGLGKPALDILEWGCGGSTVFFPRFLSECGIDFTWTSIEHNREWFNRVTEALNGDNRVMVHLVEYSGDQESLLGIDMNDYVDLPARLDRRYDLILVDGRKRRRCLFEASKLLKPGGVVFLHDAHRKYYHEGFSPYPDRHFLDYNLWRGSLRALNLKTGLDNFLNIFGYRYLYKLLPPDLRKVVRKRSLRRQGVALT